MAKQENKLEGSLVELFEATITELKRKIENHEATASDMKVIVELLKDNNITCELKEGDLADDILDDLPFESDLRVVK